MKKDCTELVFVLDRSGSMSGLEEDTIGGYNALLKKQQATSGSVILSTVLFNHRSLVVHSRVDINKVEPLNEMDYTVSGSTALLDAVGQSLRYIKRIHDQLPSTEIPEKTLFVIATDGMENASEYFSYDHINKMIESLKENNGWEFIFLGANMDSIHVARHFGIHEDYTTNYHSDKQGTRLNYDVLSDAIVEVRMKKSVQANWKDRIDEDYKRRK